MPKLIHQAKLAQNLSWAGTLLSWFTSAERASEIEGDLIEERHEHNKAWFLVHVHLTTFALFCHGFAKAPLAISMLSVASLMAGGVFTTFLLFPFVFQFEGLSVFTMMLVICVSRTLACFVVGAALIEYAPVLGSRALLGTSVLMLSVLLLRLFMHYQQWGVFADVFLGVVQSIVIYTLFSILPIILGGLYSHRNKLRAEPGASMKHCN